MTNRPRSFPFVLPIALVVVGLHASSATAEPSPCTTYQIDGFLDSPDRATALLHVDNRPLAGHEVFVQFVGPQSVSDVTSMPSMLITGPDGRVTVDLPAGVSSVVFAAESPVSAPCATDPNADPLVVFDQVPRPTGDTLTPPGADPGVPVGPPEFPAPAANLATTGPFSPVVSLAGLLFVAFGWFVRRLRGHRRPNTRGWAGRFARFPL